MKNKKNDKFDEMFFTIVISVALLANLFAALGDLLSALR